MNGQSMNDFELGMDFTLALLLVPALIFSRYDEIILETVRFIYEKDSISG